VEDPIGGNPGLLHQLGEFVNDILRRQVGLGRVGIVVLLDQALEMHRRKNLRLVGHQEYVLDHHLAIGNEFVY